MASGDTKTEAMLNTLGNGGNADEFRGCCNTKTQQYILDAIDRVQNVEDEVEELKNNPDVVDIVDTYADLQAYDTSKLTDKDIIRVLTDETHSGNSTYYRFAKDTNTWTFIGEVSGGVNAVQTMGTSTTDVMSQNAVTSALYADPTTRQLVQIGLNADAGTRISSQSGRVAIGKNATASGQERNIAIGHYAKAITPDNGGPAIGIGASVQKDYTINIGGVGRTQDGKDNVIIGFDASVEGSNRDYCVAIGRGAHCSRRAEVNIGTGPFTTKGYNNTAYRILGGVHDPEDAHDAATKGYVDASNGLARQLTSSDYNWNSAQNAAVAPYDCVAAWILDPGTYYAEADVIIRRDPSNSSSGEPVTFLVVPKQTDQGSYGDFYSVSVYFFTPNNGISIWRSYYNLFVQDEWSAGASETYVTSDTMNNALNSRIEVTWTVPDDTTYGESGKLLVYVDTSGAIPSASVYVCAGFYVDPGTQEDKYAWTQI